MVYIIWGVLSWFIYLVRAAEEQNTTALVYNTNYSFDEQQDQLAPKIQAQNHNLAKRRSLKAHEWTDINKGIWGVWKDKVYGGIGYYACGAEMRFEDNVLGDDTAANGLRLNFCHHNNWNDQTEFKDIYSGKWGAWKGKKMCPLNMYIDGAMVKFEGYQGSDDDTALNGLKIRCITKNGNKISWVSIYEGLWGTWNQEVIRPGKFVTGAQIQFEDDQGSGDDTAWNGLKFKFEPMPSASLLPSPSDMFELLYQCVTIKDLIGKNFEARDKRGHTYTLTKLGENGSLFDQTLSGNRKYNIGIYESTSETNTVSYKRGKYCGSIGKRREGKFKLVESSKVTSSTITIREPSTCVYEMVLTIPICDAKMDSPTQSLLNVLQEFETEARVCNEDGLALAKIIEDNLINNIKAINPLKEKMDKIIKPFKKVYEIRNFIKRMAKMVPKVGKMIIIVVKKIEALYVGFKNFSNTLSKYVEKVPLPKPLKKLRETFTVADLLVSKLKKVHFFLAGEVDPTKTSLSLGVGLAHLAGTMADAAVKSRDAINLAENCSNQKSVDSFSEKALPKMNDLLIASKSCSIIKNTLGSVDLSFLGTLYKLIDQVYEAIQPVLDLIDTILKTVASQATEALCCITPPHLQAAVQAISQVIDFSTCFAGPVEGLLDDLIRELVPDVDIFHKVDILLPLVEFSFFGINFNKNDCKLDFETPILVLKENIDIDFSFDFNLYEYLSVEDDGTDFTDDLEKSCDPNKLANEISDSWGGDCCCTARDIVSEPGTFCLDFIAFAGPGYYEVAAKATGLERCTCCEDGVYSTKGCKGATGYCGTLPPPVKNVGDLCPSTVDCECGLNGLECGKRNYWDQETYVCCKKTIVPDGWTTDLCVVENEGDQCGTTEDAECAGSMGCARKTASDKDKNNYRCCKRVGTFGEFDYCLDMEDESICWSDAQCKSGFCKGNRGGTKRGVCKRKKDRGESCDINSDCKNNSCGRAHAATNAKTCCNSDSYSYWEANGKDYCNGLLAGNRCHEDSNCSNGACGRPWYGTDIKICCHSGDTTRYINVKDYCTGMPDNYACKTDSMCASRLCLNNKCTRKKNEGDRCWSEKNAECHNGNCYRSTRKGDYRCCRDTNYCDTWNSGCTTGFYYCEKYGDKLG
jgi:hypothetical protein